MTVNVKSVGNKEYYEKSVCWTMDLGLPQNRGGEVESLPEKADIHSYSPEDFLNHNHSKARLLAKGVE